MVTPRYQGQIIREDEDGGDGFGLIISAVKPIEVDAADPKEARRKMLGLYAQNEKDFTPNRTSECFPNDKIFVKGLEEVTEDTYRWP